MTDFINDPASSARGAELSSNYTSSLRFDRRLYRYDIAASIAHVRMLSKQKILTTDDCNVIVSALRKIEVEIATDAFQWRDDLEDLHMNVEARLFDLIGEVAGRLHTARSRNDQVSTDTRLYARDAGCQAEAGTRELQEALLDLAEENLETIMPGYTHIQRGQPVLLSHHLLAYFEMLDRDANRFLAASQAADVMTLGSGAIAGVSYPIDRLAVAEELEFSSISANSIDAVSDRDFLVDFIYAASVCMMHLSRLAEELVIWSTEEFGFIRIGDGYTTGSSIMPQKRNPDFAELARGKTGRIYGHLMSILTMLKGIPMAYNRDLQEDKEPLFDSVDTVLATLGVMTGMLRDLKVDRKRMRDAAESSYVLATDIADYLVAKGLPFRDAHIVVGNLSRIAMDSQKMFTDLSLVEYKQASSMFEKDIFDLTIDLSVAARDVHGGTSPERVKGALQEARSRLETFAKKI